ncbi:MAG: hypothetical protein M3680_20785 [Myxococcota bacterium]|nr:hypothetical protein [Myxococcota bacterium]
MIEVIGVEPGRMPRASRIPVPWAPAVVDGGDTGPARPCFFTATDQFPEAREQASAETGLRSITIGRALAIRATGSLSGSPDSSGPSRPLGAWRGGC